MKTKELVVSCFLLSIGFVSHTLIPGLFGGIRPDFLLAMMILAIAMNLSFKMAVVCGVLAGILAAFSTSFPGGELLSLVDKFVAAMLVYYLLKVSDNITLITFLGTMASGIVFVFGALLMNGLDLGMMNLLFLVVIPTAILNALMNRFISRRLLSL